MAFSKIDLILPMACERIEDRCFRLTEEQIAELDKRSEEFYKKQLKEAVDKLINCPKCKVKLEVRKPKVKKGIQL